MRYLLVLTTVILWYHRRKELSEKVWRAMPFITLVLGDAGFLD
jgi:hypothetical protein